MADKATEQLAEGVSSSVAKELDTLRQQSLTTIVQGEIERMVLEGTLNPGERVNENALSAALGVSRGPIREACRGLQAMGLLEMIRNRGFFVVELDEKDAAEVYEARAGVFAYACMLAAERSTESDTNKLTSLVEKMDAFADAGDTEGYTAANREFHESIMQIAANERLKRLHETLFRETNLLRLRAFEKLEDLPKSNAEHKAILTAISAGDGAKAFQSAKEHVAAGKSRHIGHIMAP